MLTGGLEISEDFGCTLNVLPLMWLDGLKVEGGSTGPQSFSQYSGLDAELNPELESGLDAELDSGLDCGLGSGLVVWIERWTRRVNPSLLLKERRTCLRDHLPEVQKHIVSAELAHRLAVGSYCDVVLGGALSTWLQSKVVLK